METFTATEKTTLKRLPKRGEYDRQAVYQILDEAFLCHVGFVVDRQPYVIPTGYARIEDQLYIHGSQASRMLRSLAGGIEVCVTVTLLDGLVLARSAFHHSMNYRSVVVLGKATVVESAEEKFAALKAFTDHVVPDRWADVREPNEQEIKGTLVLQLPLVEVSAKVRTGPPLDDEEDYAIPVWAGVLPLQLTPSAPVQDDRMLTTIEVPDYVLNYSKDSKEHVKFEERKAMALEMRSKCERCNQALAADSEAFICSYECTFCGACAQEMSAICPNCQGELLRRPRRKSS